jgi:hypothetical protein
MTYRTCMQKGTFAIVIVILLFIGSAGCLSSSPVAQTTSEPTPTITATPTPVGPVSRIGISGMALQLADIPSDYILKDRSDVPYSKTTQLSRDLGWREGYSVTFYRLNPEKFDMTGLRQTITLYPIQNMNRVFDMAKEEIVSPVNGETGTIFELPLTRIGDQSIAYKRENTSIPNSLPVYTILFVKKDVFETLQMGGTTTDYETLKELARIAVDKIQ